MKKKKLMFIVDVSNDAIFSPNNNRYLGLPPANSGGETVKILFIHNVSITATAAFDKFANFNLFAVLCRLRDFFSDVYSCSWLWYMEDENMKNGM